MVTVTIEGQQKILLTHKEKAQELGIATKTLTRWKKTGKMENIAAISIPGYKRQFYFASN